MNSVLVVTPVLRDTSGRGRVFPRALRSHLEMQWEGALDWYQLVGGDNWRDGSATVTAKYNRARAVFLAGNWTHMLCLETDMIVPSDVLAKLLALEADIGYALYCFRHNGAQEWNAALVLQEKAWYAYSKQPETARALWGQQADVAGLGQGCTLLKRQLVEALLFRCWPGISSDWALACDAQAHGFSQRCDFSAICGHMSLMPSPCILWPDPNEEHLVRIDYLQP